LNKIGENVWLFFFFFEDLVKEMKRDSLMNK